MIRLLIGLAAPASGLALGFVGLTLSPLGLWRVIAGEAVIIALLLAVAYFLWRLVRRGGTEAEATIAQAVRCAPAGVYRYDHTGAITFTEPGDGLGPLGWSPGSFVGRNAVDLAATAGPEAAAAVAGVLDRHEPGGYTREVEGRHGARRWLSVHHAPLADGGGLALLFDVTGCMTELAAVKRERDALAERVAFAERQAANLTEQLQAERTVRTRLDALAACAPAGPTTEQP